MDEWTEIRRKVLVEGASKRSIHPGLRDRPPGPGQDPGQRRASRLSDGRGPPEARARAHSWASSTRSWPLTRRPRPSSATRPGGSSSACVTSTATPAATPRSRRRCSGPSAYSKEAFVPLSHPPGHAQFDFGEAVVEIAGERCKAALGVITLPYSDTYFVSAYPRECTETFQAAHVAGFDFFGGVPLRISYDNTTIAVTKVMGTRARADQGVLAPREPLPLRPPLLPGGAGQREGPRREPRRLLDGGTSWSRCRRSRHGPR